MQQTITHKGEFVINFFVCSNFLKRLRHLWNITIKTENGLNSLNVISSKKIFNESSQFSLFWCIPWVCSTDNFLSPTFWPAFFTLCSHILFWYSFLLLFNKKNYVFIVFISLLTSVKCLQQNINQSETGINDKKVSVKLYALYGHPRDFKF